MRANVSSSTCKSSKQTQHVSACLKSDGGEANAVAVVEEKEVVVVVVSFAFIPSSLFSFVLHFVAFSSSSCCGGSGADVEVVVVVADVVLVVVVVCSFPSLASSSSSLSFFGAGLFSAFTVAVAVASLNVLHSLRCPPFFQWCTWHSRPQYCTVWHNLQGFNGRNGVLGLPQVEQQRMVGVVCPSSLSNRWRY